MEDQKQPIEPAYSEPVIADLSVTDLILAVQFLVKEEARMSDLERHNRTDTDLDNFFYTAESAFRQRIALNIALVKRLSDLTGIPAK